MTQEYIHHGTGAVRPYLYGRLDLPNFVKQAFGAEEVERHDYGSNEFHVEVGIGDSMLVMEISDSPQAEATLASIYVYVPDVNAAYQRALQAGGSSIAEPEDKPYSERSAGVKDSFGNIWWISTFKNSVDL